MKILHFLSALALLILSNAIGAQNSINRPLLFDSGWKFHRGGALSAEKPDFNDLGWRKLDLPHDWSIEDLPGTNSPFNPDAISQVNGGFTTGGTGWYRKTFSIPEDQKGKRVVIQFDGVFQNADVWVNGQHVGSHPYGYTAFWFDLTDKIVYGKNNLIAVKVRNEGENSRWYTGSGIYRHVWLQISDPVHVAQWGVYITTPEVNPEQSRVNVKTKVENLSGKMEDVKIVTRIISPSGAEVSKTESEQKIENGSIAEADQNLIVKSPLLWSVETPSVYTAITEVFQNSVLKDSKETKFGIRTISFDAANGFRLNGQTIKLKGGCLHHDNGPLGSRTYDRAEERRIELLKASGYNAVRTSHNPPSASFLDACDRLGMLVMDETFDMWREPKNPDDYNLYFDKWWQKDVESMIYRDRNHPSIIMWSIGNEIPNRHKPEVVKIAKMLADFIRSIEPTRPVTSAVNDLKPDKDPYFATLDIAGYNYASGGDHGQSSLYATDNLRVPQRIMAGTESYPLEAFAAWMEVIDHPYVIGDFVWTAFDYIGEASIGWRGYWQEQNFFPWNLAFCGDIDVCGWKRPQSYYRDAIWMENQVSVFVTPPQPSFDLNPNRQSWSKWHWFDAVASWNWNGNEGKPVEVNVYSSCEQVELFLNGKSLGKKPTNRSTKFMAAWQVPYEPGILKAVGLKGKKIVNSSQLTTAGEVSRITMKADRQTIKSDNQDLAYVTIELTDTKDVLNPVAENLINFELQGPGTIIAVGNANPMSTESFQLNERKAWHGKCLVIIKSGNQSGDIVLKATSPGLSSSEIKIQTVN